MRECYFDTQFILESNSDNIEMDTFKKSSYRKSNREYLANRYFIDRIPILKDALKWQNVCEDTLEYVNNSLLHKFEISD